ncbi:cytokinin dehydrogenase 3 [Fusarium tjaetaba]|uniref:Cytokinin dehydrogenase 3 n=1 Tax=Fusarium tjaetaba TaxID=1567544 RepID=A0A8H5RC61_9HYPO|nr:cytokinin dehydrogenase 3 [Fusarium tjaetaba]KAF5630148.1 cytokinin dehydrogenase 3 [Fusarium tjaetaba]
MEPSFQGNQFFPGTAAYNRANNIYATSTYGVSRDMNPSEILQPASVEDIPNVVKAAAQMGKPLTTRL